MTIDQAPRVQGLTFCELKLYADPRKEPRDGMPPSGSVGIARAKPHRRKVEHANGAQAE